jgi:hypothetical protein
MHHYQSGYAFFDRNDLLPLTEASSTLIEREAQATYAKEGIQLLEPKSNNAFMDMYSQGIDGPTVWTESDAQAHGYGLSWFLEYCRDEKYKGAKESFHAELLAQWGATYVSAHHNTLRWAAGGSDYSLGDALDSFAFHKVLPGMTKSTPYGRQYFPREPKAVYLTPFKQLDLTKTPVVDFAAEMPRFSIQYYQLQRPSQTGAQLVVRIPRQWSTTRPGRSTYFGTNAEDNAKIRMLSQAEVATDSPGDFSHVLLASSSDDYVFVVDKGSEPKGFLWGKGLPPASVFVLSPPGGVKTKPSMDLEVSCESPAATGKSGLKGVFRVYAPGKKEPLAEVPDGKTSVAIDSTKAAGATEFEVSWAVEVGSLDGKPVYLESAKSGSKPTDIALTPGNLPAGWGELRDRRWNQPNYRLSKETRLLLSLGVKQPEAAGVLASGIVAVYGMLDSVVHTTTKTVAQMQAECPANSDPELRQMSCYVTPDATRTTISGYPAWRSSFGSRVISGGAPTSDMAGTSGSSIGACTSYLVDVGGGTFVTLLAQGGCLQILDDAVPACAAQSVAALTTAESVAKSMRIDRK